MEITPPLPPARKPPIEEVGYRFDHPYTVAVLNRRAFRLTKVSE